MSKAMKMSTASEDTFVNRFLADDKEFLRRLSTLSKPPSTFRDQVSNTKRFPLPSTDMIRSRRPSLFFSKQESTSFDENSNESSSGTDNGALRSAKSNYRIMILGANKSGKTSIIQQFLYDKFSDTHKETMDDMYRGEFDIYGKTIGFDIQDVSGGYVYEFPGMRSVSLASADAFVLVFSFDSCESWDEVGRLRDMIQAERGEDIPIVVVGNKTDLMFSIDNRIPLESLEAIVIFDWENGYVECSAKERFNINKIFKELLQQAKAKYDFDSSSSSTSSNASHLSSLQFPLRRNSILRNSKDPGTIHQNLKGTPKKSPHEDMLKRRQSLPMLYHNKSLAKNAEKSVGRRPPPFVSSITRKRGSTVPKDSMIQSSKIAADYSINDTKINGEDESRKSKINRRASMAALRKDSCRVS